MGFYKTSKHILARIKQIDFFTSFTSPLRFTVSETVLYLLSFEAHFNDGMYITNIVYFDCSPGIQQPTWIQFVEK